MPVLYAPHLTMKKVFLRNEKTPRTQGVFQLI